MNKAEILSRIMKAAEEDIYCGDVCYSNAEGEFCRVEGLKLFRKHVEEILDE